MLSSKSPVFNETELLEQYKESGDLETLGKVFSAHTAFIYGVCLKYLRDRDEAKDAVMQIFEKLIPSLREHKVENFKSWLYVTTRNYCLMILRSRKSRNSGNIPVSLMENTLALHPDQQDNEEDLTRLEKCISELGAEQQVCVRLFFLEEKCYKEIAGTAGLDLGEVKSHIQNGKRNLKICMERNG